MGANPEPYEDASMLYRESSISDAHSRRVDGSAWVHSLELKAGMLWIVEELLVRSSGLALDVLW